MLGALPGPVGPGQPAGVKGSREEKLWYKPGCIVVGGGVGGEKGTEAKGRQEGGREAKREGHTRSLKRAALGGSRDKRVQAEFQKRERLDSPCTLGARGQAKPQLGIKSEARGVRGGGEAGRVKT